MQARPEDFGKIPMHHHVSAIIDAELAAERKAAEGMESALHRMIYHSSCETPPLKSKASVHFKAAFDDGKEAIRTYERARKGE